MSAHIHSWIDGYTALRARAYEMRGAIELDSGPRWPRTTGEDVIAIAAIFDAAIPRDVLPSLPAAANFTAVIEEKGGARSFWALAHPAAKPDFHDPACFTAELAPPAST